MDYSWDGRRGGDGDDGYEEMEEVGRLDYCLCSHAKGACCCCSPSSSVEDLGEKGPDVDFVSLLIAVVRFSNVNYPGYKYGKYT